MDLIFKRLIHIIDITIVNAEGRMEPLMRDTKVIIKKSNLKENYDNYCKMGTEVMVVVKANAYGHGIVESSRYFEEIGVETLAVATLTEAVELRENNIESDLLIMGHTPDRYLEKAVEIGAIVTVFSLDQCKILEKMNKPRVYIKIDTGFNRIGYKDHEKAIRDIQLIDKMEVKIEGIFTHLALRNEESDKNQFIAFSRILDRLKSLKINYGKASICDSIGALIYPEYHLDTVRVGAGIYGLCTRPTPFKLKNTMTFISKITEIKIVEIGESIGYDEEIVTDRKIKIAVLPFGYGDGIPRNITDSGYVLINGEKAPYLGILCMDQCMVDITDIDRVDRGDDVLVFGEHKNNILPISHLASWCKTNRNSIITGISSRVIREFIH